MEENKQNDLGDCQYCLIENSTKVFCVLNGRPCAYQESISLLRNLGRPLQEFCPLYFANLPMNTVKGIQNRNLSVQMKGIDEKAEAGKAEVQDWFKKLRGRLER